MQLHLTKAIQPIATAPADFFVMHIYKGDNNMKSFVMMIAIFLFTAINADAIDKVTCFTDKNQYYHGEKVLITITNISSDALRIPDREYIDGRFARPASEMKYKNGRTWMTMKMVTTKDKIKTKELKKNESHVYTLRLLTMAESRKEILTTPGVYATPNTYKVIFHTEYDLLPFEIESNEFIVQSNTDTSK